jgi:hypothetical protein
MPAPLNFTDTSLPFFFGGGGPGAGYFADLFGAQRNDLALNQAGVGLPALAASAASTGYPDTPYAKGGPGQAAAQGAFSQLANSLNTGQANKLSAQNQITRGDIAGITDTTAGYSDALSTAISNAIRQQQQDAESQLQQFAMFGNLLRGGLELGTSLFGGPGASGYIGRFGPAGLLGPFGGAFSSATGTP